MTLPLPVCQFLSSLTAVILPGSAAAPPSLDCLSSGAAVEITDTTWSGPLHWASVQELKLALSYLPVQWEGNWTWHWHGWAHELLHKSVSSWDLRSGFPSCCRLVLVTGPQHGQTLDKPNQRHICRNLLLEEKVFRRNVASQPWVKSDVKIKFYI